MWPGLQISLPVFVVLLIALELGRRFGARYRRSHEGGSATSEADGVVFAMLGLLIAFTFTSSAGRFSERRELIVKQVNALDMAWARLDLLSPADREAIRRPMRRWVDLAANADEMLRDPKKVAAGLLEVERLQNEVWTAAIAALRGPQSGYTVFIMTPINEWISLTCSRASMDQLGLPPMVLETLVMIALLGSILAGFSMSRKPERSLLHMTAFSVAIAIALHVIIDLNNPRAGLIRMGDMDARFAELGDRFERWGGSTSELPD